MNGRVVALQKFQVAPIFLRPLNQPAFVIVVIGGNIRSDILDVAVQTSKIKMTGG